MDFTNYFQGLQHLKLFLQRRDIFGKVGELGGWKAANYSFIFHTFWSLQPDKTCDNKETNVYVQAGKYDSFQGTPTHTLWIKVVYRSFNVLSWRTVFFLFDD